MPFAHRLYAYTGLERGEKWGRSDLLEPGETEESARSIRFQSQVTRDQDLRFLSP